MAKVPPFSELIAATTTLSGAPGDAGRLHADDRGSWTGWPASRSPVPANPGWSDLVRATRRPGSPVPARPGRVRAARRLHPVRVRASRQGSTSRPASRCGGCPAGRRPDLCLPGNDFWVFDDRLVRFSHFAGNGEFLEDELSRRPGRGRAVRRRVRGCLGPRHPARRVPARLTSRMAVSPSSSVQRARQQLAERLRDLRLDAGLTAGRCRLRPAGTRPRPAGSSRPSRRPARPTSGPGAASAERTRQAIDLIAASRAADSMYTEWRRLNRTGLRHVQEAPRPLYERTRLFRVYCSDRHTGLPPDTRLRHRAPVRDHRFPRHAR